MIRYSIVDTISHYVPLAILVTFMIAIHHWIDCQSTMQYLSHGDKVITVNANMEMN